MVFSSSVIGGVVQDEIDHLLKTVKNTECIFERNGNKYKGSQAFKHIKKKIDYYKDEINSAEKFIELTATKSMMSGQYYMIECKGNKIIKNKKWLLDELMKYRVLKNTGVSSNTK